MCVVGGVVWCGQDERDRKRCARCGVGLWSVVWWWVWVPEGPSCRHTGAGSAFTDSGAGGPMPWPMPGSVWCVCHLGASGTQIEEGLVSFARSIVIAVDRQGEVEERSLNFVPVRSSAECWPWRGNTNSHGYGRFRYMDQTYLAHRFAYVLFVGEVPRDRVIHHTCESRDCVNPSHLRVLSRSDQWREHLG